MYEMPKQRKITFCELCNNDISIGIRPPTDGEVNYLCNQQTLGKYQNNFQRNNNFNQWWIFEIGPSYKQPYQNYTQVPP